MNLGTDEKANSGIRVNYVRTRRVVELYGWYDGFVGIEPVLLSLGEFCRTLGITPKDVELALKKLEKDERSKE